MEGKVGLCDEQLPIERVRRHQVRHIGYQPKTLGSPVDDVAVDLAAADHSARSPGRFEDDQLFSEPGELPAHGEAGDPAPDDGDHVSIAYGLGGSSLEPFVHQTPAPALHRHRLSDPPAAGSADSTSSTRSAR